MEFYLFFIFSKDNENMVKLSGGGNKACVETKSHRKVSYDERTLIPEFQEEKFRLNPHVDGFTQQVNLVNRLNIHWFTISYCYSHLIQNSNRSSGSKIFLLWIIKDVERYLLHSFYFPV